MLQKLILISAMTLALFLFSCDDEGKLNDVKNGEVSKDNLEIISTSSTFTNPFEYVGVWHNEGMTYVTDSSVADSTYSNQERKEDVTSLINDFLVNNKGQIESEVSKYEAEVLKETLLDSMFSVNAPTVFSPRSVLSDKLSDMKYDSILSNLEESKILDCYDYVFDYDFSGMTKDQVMDTIIYRTYEMLEDWSSTTWGSGGDGNFLAVYIAVIGNSAQYWKDNNTSGEPEIAPWVAADAVGAVIGAGAAAALDQYDSGSIDWGHVGLGALFGAVGFSVPGTKWFKKCCL